VYSILYKKVLLLFCSKAKIIVNTFDTQVGGTNIDLIIIILYRGLKYNYYININKCKPNLPKILMNV